MSSGDGLAIGADEASHGDLGFVAAPPRAQLAGDALGVVALAAVLGDDVGRRADVGELAVVDPGHALAELLDLTEPVAHEHDGAAVGSELLDLLGALALEALVTDRQHLVDQQHLRFDVGGDGEAEADEHPGRVVLHRRVDELLEAGKRDDVVEAQLDLALRQPEDGTVQEHVLAAGELHVEAGPELEQGRDPTVHRGPALLGPEDAGHALQQGALARPVRADDAERLARRHLELDALERPELSVLGAPSLEDGGLQVLVLLLVETEALPELVDDHRVLVGHDGHQSVGSGPGFRPSWRTTPTDDASGPRGPR